MNEGVCGIDNLAPRKSEAYIGFEVVELPPFEECGRNELRNAVLGDHKVLCFRSEQFFYSFTIRGVRHTVVFLPILLNFLHALNSIY